MGALQNVFNAVFLAEPCNRGIVPLHPAEHGVEGDSNKLVVYADEAPKLYQSQKQGKAVLAARNSHRNAVAVLNQVELLNCLAHIS